MNHHPTVQVKPREGKRARSGSPWLFSNEIEIGSNLKALPKGALVNVTGDDGHVFGTGYFNPNSLIAVRLLSREVDVAIDAEFFARRLIRARRQVRYPQRPHHPQTGRDKPRPGEHRLASPMCSSPAASPHFRPGGGAGSPRCVAC